MAPARRNVSGRSPLVNQQRQITAFFSKNTSTTPSPSPSPSPTICKQNPNPKIKPSQSPPSSSPTTPSPIQSNMKRPLLVIGQSPLTPDAKKYGDEVLGRRIRVYWPLDKTWYEGVVKSFDKESGSHLVCYDDAEEESLDLGKEKFEWIEESTRFKRLRRRGDSLALRRMVIEDDDEVDNVDDKTDGLSDDSSDEDWGKKKEEKEASEVSEEDDMDLVDEKEETEEEEEGEKLAAGKGKRGKKNESLKRKENGGGKQDTAKKSKISEDASKGKAKVPAMEPIKIVGSK